MKVDHLTGSITLLGGGVPVALGSLLRAQERLGLETRVIGWKDGGETLSDWPEGSVQSFDRESHWGLPSAAGMGDLVRDGGRDLLHLHGLWTGGSLVTSTSGKLYMVSPHGMLDPWALKHSALKKRLAGAVFEKRNLRGAACLHALCRSEADSMRAYGLSNPIAIIPNGVELPERLKTEKLKTERKTLLFLGRLHPKKGLINALRALSETLKSESGKLKWETWQFVIAGWGQGGHEAELKELCREEGFSVASIPVDDFLSDTPKHGSAETPPSVVFVGAAFGDQKDALLRRADAFILPSFSEGLPMSVLEAWAYSVPVLMTDHCNLPEGFQQGAAVRIGTEVGSIGEGLAALAGFTEDQLRVMGDAGRALVEERFTWDQVAAQMKSVYEWVLGKGEEPDCVVRQKG